MRVCLESNDPLRVHLEAARLRDGGFHPEVINEASYVTGYPGVMGWMTVLVPDAEHADARKLMHEEPATPLPEEPEFADPPPVGGPSLPLHLPSGPQHFLRLALVFFLVFAALGFFYLAAALPVTVWLVR